MAIPHSTSSTPAGKRLIFDLRGRRFGRYTVLDRPHELRSLGRQGKSVQVCWWCACDCGSEPRLVSSGNLRSGNTTSCGCYRAEVTGQLRRTHGQTGSPEHRAWKNMIRRCTEQSKDYRWYGARGITVCDAWRHSFEVFLADVGPRPSKSHTLERMDNERGYEKGNVCWASRTAQLNNTRRNRLLCWQGRTQTMAQWARETGLSYCAIRTRLNLGWSVERALSVPAPQKRST